MTEINALTADKLRDEHYQAARNCLAKAEEAMKHDDRQGIVALANAHIRLAELLTTIGRP